MIAMTLLSLVMAITSGCSSEPTMGDKMGNFGKGLSDLGNQWNKGQQMIKEGDEMVKDGQGMIDNGNNNISKGKQMREQGEEMMRESERQFKEKGGTFPPQ
jgi:uncharacterized phage infection (PIP) family protein YhgE